jgi:hypothetical protein
MALREDNYRNGSRPDEHLSQNPCRGEELFRWSYSKTDRSRLPPPQDGYVRTIGRLSSQTGSAKSMSEAPQLCLSSKQQSG